jgi:hypothetical protein
MTTKWNHVIREGVMEGRQTVKAYLNFINLEYTPLSDKYIYKKYEGCI